jgi:hypothetical protein
MFAAPATSSSPLEKEKVGLEGKVIQKLECKPTSGKFKFKYSFS